MPERSPRHPLTSGLLRGLARPPRKVVVLRASRLGDFVCAGPAFRALRNALPQAEIAVIALPALRGLAERLPYLDRFIAHPGFPGLAERRFTPGGALAFFRAMQAERFDLAVQMQGATACANPFALMLGARRTAGFISPGDTPGRLDAALALPDSGHEIERTLSLPAFLGAAPCGAHTEYPLRDVDRHRAEAVLGAARPPFIGLHAGALRRWPAENVVAAARELRRRRKATVVIVGGPEARRAGEALARAVGPRSLNLAGRLSLGTLGGVIERLALLLTNDSGPAHVAYALGTATVAIYRKGDTRRYAPPPGGPFRCVVPEAAGGLRQVVQVLQAAEELLSRAA